MLAERSQWFKEQSALLEKEYAEEKLRSSGSSQGRAGLSYSSANPPSAGPLMSRTARLIHGFGLDKPRAKYKPLIGSDYVPIPMSQRSAATYQMGVGHVNTEEEIETNGTAKKRRKRGSIDRSYDPRSDDSGLEEEEEYDMSDSARKRRRRVQIDRSYRPDPRFDEEEPEEEYNEVIRQGKGVHHTIPRPAIKPSKNPFDALAQEDESLYDEDEGDSAQQDGYSEQYYQNGTTQDADTDDLLEDEGEEEDDLLDDEEDEDEDDDEADYYRPGDALYEDAPTPATQVSHVSGGATKEEAIELDSD